MIAEKKYDEAFEQYDKAVALGKTDMDMYKIRTDARMLAFEGDSQVVWFEGNYQDYEADRRRRLGAAADQPHRIHYKKLIH